MCWLFVIACVWFLLVWLLVDDLPVVLWLFVVLVGVWVYNNVGIVHFFFCYLLFVLGLFEFYWLLFSCCFFTGLGFEGVCCLLALVICLVCCCGCYV